MKKYDDLSFVLRLFNIGFHNDLKFKKMVELFKNMSEDTKNIISESENVSPKFLDKIIDQSKKDRLNIYIQNIVCMM